MRGKRGVDYAIMLLIVVVMGLLTLFIQIDNKVDSIPKDIGFEQATVMRVDAEKGFITAFVRSAAKHAMAGAVRDVASNPIYQGFSTSGQGKCAVVNEQRIREVKMPNIAGGITAAFNRYMNPYLDAYQREKQVNIPTSNYELYVEKGQVSGIALRPVIMPLQDVAGRNVGKISFKPSFKLAYDHKFEEYPLIFDRLNDIAQQCPSAPDPVICAEGKKLADNWQIERQGSSLRFIIPRGEASACYLLVLPSAVPTT